LEEFVTVDFLVFKYHGSSHLKALIFDPSGCEKPSSVFMKKATQSETNEPVGGMESQHNDLAMEFSSNGRKRSWAEWDNSEQGNNTIHIGSSRSSHDPSG
jgi:hypothetical protein